MTHALKCWPEYFEPIEKGNKLFELRKCDRPYIVGDDVLIQEYEPATKLYTGREAKFNICFILKDLPKSFGLKEGYCILGLKVNEEY